jgi:phospholipid transport system substrate-binding protein
MNRKRFATRVASGTVACALMLAASVVAAPAAATAMAAVKSAVNEALKILADPKYKSAPESERGALLKLLDADFDFPGMARSALGPDWKKLSADQQKHYSAAFKGFLEARYVKIIESYSGQKIDFVKESTTGPDRSEVLTNISSPMLQTPLDFNYMLRNEGGQWKVYDMVIAGQSEVASYRDEFTKLMNGAGGFDGLMKKLANP